MMKKIKKLLSILIAFALIFTSSAVPAVADENNEPAILKRTVSFIHAGTGKLVTITNPDDNNFQVEVTEPYTKISNIPISAWLNVINSDQDPKLVSLVGYPSNKVLKDNGDWVGADGKIMNPGEVGGWEAVSIDESINYDDAKLTELGIEPVEGAKLVGIKSNRINSMLTVKENPLIENIPMLSSDESIPWDDGHPAYTKNELFWMVIISEEENPLEEKIYIQHKASGKLVTAPGVEGEPLYVNAEIENIPDNAYFSMRYADWNDKEVANFYNRHEDSLWSWKVEGQDVFQIKEQKTPSGWESIVIEHIEGDYFAFKSNSTGNYYITIDDDGKMVATASTPGEHELFKIYKNTKPGQVKNITCTDTDSNSISLKWMPFNKTLFTGLEIWRSQSADHGYEKVGEAVDNTFTDTGLEMKTTYFYKIKTINANNPTSETKPFEVKTLSYTIKELKSLYDANINKEKTETITQSSWEVFIKALEAAGTIINTETPDDYEQSDITTAQNTLETAITNLVDFTSLKELYETVSSKEENKHKKNSWDAFKKALDNAKSVLDDIENKIKLEVDTTYTSLKTAADNLVPFDPSTLSTLINQWTNEDIVASKYNRNSWNAFESALKAAQALVKDVDGNGTQDDLDAAYTALNTAAGNLIPFDLTELNAYVNKCKHLKESDYTKELWTSLQNVIKAANDLMQNENGTQDNIVPILNKLKNEIIKLENYRKTFLKTAIDRFDKIAKSDSSKYTPATWKAFINTLQAAKRIVNNPDSTILEINAALASVENIFKLLKPVSNIKIPSATKITVKATGIAGNQKVNKLYLKKGSKLTLKATVVPSKALQGVTYKSSKTKVAAISKKGVIKAKNAGKSTITVTSKDAKKNYKIKVTVYKKTKAAKKITGTKKISLKVKTTKNLKTKITPTTTTDRVTCKSRNKKIAAVDQYGAVTAKKKGKTIITVKCGKKLFKVKVTVK